MTREQAQTLLEAIRTLDAARRDRDRWRERAEDHERKLMAAYAEIRELNARLRDFELGLL